MNNFSEFGLSPAHDQYLTEYFNSKKRISFQHGAIHSGKTDSAIVGALLQFASHEGNAFIIGKTATTIHRNILMGTRKLLHWAGDRALRTDSMGNKYVHIGGTKAYLIGANDVRAKTKVRGGTFSVGGLIDELPLCDQELVLHALGRANKPESRVFLTGNPEGPYHWSRQTLILKNPDVFERSFTIDDNPSMTDSEKDYLKRQYTGVWYDRLIRGLWVLAEGVIYSSFTENNNLFYHEMDTYDEIIVGVDYGTQNPTVFYIILVLDGVFYVCYEWFYDARKKRVQLSTNEYVDEFIKFTDFLPRGFRTYVDENARDFIISLRKRGYSVFSANTHDPATRCRTIDAMFSRRQVMISDGCSELRRCISNYIWDSNRQKKGEDYPLKFEDDPCNAMEYGIYSHINAGRITQAR